MSSANEKRMPLSGVKVVELATVVAAPTSGRIMAEFGADVIKIESPGGDFLRGVGAGLALPTDDDNNPLFDMFNSGKRLVGINLKTENGMKVMKKLLAEADIFVSNVRMPSLVKMGLGYEEVHEEFPNLIYAHLSGFGLAGEGAGDPGFDTTAFWTRSGALLDSVLDGDFPIRPTYAFGDIATSGYFLSAILMALVARQNGAGGTMVSTSLLNSGMWHNMAHLVDSQDKYGRLYPLDRNEPWSPTADYYQCADGVWLAVIGKFYPKDRPTFAKLFDMPELVEDPDLATLADMARSGKTSMVSRKMEEKMREKTSDEWIKIFKEIDIPVEKLIHFQDALDDPQIAPNGYTEDHDYKDGDPTKFIVPPMQFSEYEKKPFAQEGTVGAQTAEVLTELGYTDEEITAMADTGDIVV